MTSPTNPDATASYQLSAVPAGATSRVYWYVATATSPTLNPSNSSTVQLGTGDGKSPIPLQISNGTAAVPVYVALVVNDSNGKPVTPLGIVMKKTGPLSGGGTDPQGLGTFPSVTISGNTMTLCDNENDKASYDFDVLFMDNSGHYGLLDPKIYNT